MSLNNNLSFQLIGGYDVPNADFVSGAIEIPYNTTHKFIYVSYGTKNQTQAYGGGTVVIPIVENKPCFLPIYNGVGTTPLGIIYIFNDYNNKIIKTYCLNSSVQMYIRVGAFG